VVKVIDHALRRAGYAPESAGAEWMEIAQDLLYIQLAELVNAGFPLWTKVYGVLSCQVASPDVLLPAGTVDCLHMYWRTFNPYRGPATTTGAASAQQLFSGAPGPDLTIAGPNPGVIVSFTGGPTEVDTVGILLGGNTSITTALTVLTSVDGMTWTTAQVLPSATYVPRQWTYFDLNPAPIQPYIQVQYTGGASWTLNQVNLGLANGTDIEIGQENIDDYYNLPNKNFLGDRANLSWLDRQIDPIIKIWPTVNQQGFYNGTVTALYRRYIQDPGALTNILEIPARWYEGVTARLGIRLMDELPDQGQDAQASYFSLMAKQQRRQNLDQAATKAEGMMWAEERSHGPLRWMPGIGVYNR
jgi:hypothetical protein